MLCEELRIAAYSSGYYHNCQALSLVLQCRLLTWSGWCAQAGWFPIMLLVRQIMCPAQTNVSSSVSPSRTVFVKLSTTVLLMVAARLTVYLVCKRVHLGRKLSAIFSMSTLVWRQKIYAQLVLPWATLVIGVASFYLQVSGVQWWKCCKNIIRHTAHATVSWLTVKPLI